MKILASKRELPTYDDYAASGKFSSEQLKALRDFGKNLNSRQLALLANPDFDSWQMSSISYALQLGIPIRVVSLWADPRFTERQMECLLEYAYYDGIDADTLVKMADPNLSPSRMVAVAAACRRGAVDKLDYIFELMSKYKLESAGANIIHRLVQYVIDGRDSRSLDLIFGRDLDAWQMAVVADGFDEGLSYEKVEVYAHPEFDVILMSRIEEAFVKGASIPEVEEYIESSDGDVDLFTDYLIDTGYYADDDDDD